MKMHVIQGYIQAIYLIEYSDKLLLFDSGSKADVSKVIEFITLKLHRPITDLKLVAVSHPHPDHIGGAATFQKTWKIPIAMNLESTRWYTGFSGRLNYFIDVLLTYYVGHRLKQNKWVDLFFQGKMKPDHLLNEGSHLPGFGDWIVLQTPGHTPMDMCFYHSDSESIYVADMFIKKRDKFIRPYPIYLPQEYRTSLGRVLKLPIKNFLLAHYGIVQLNSVERESLHEVLEATPRTPRTHRRSLYKIVKKLLRFS